MNAELPGTAAFSAASVAVREDDVAEQIPCGADIEQFLERIAAFKDAGFTHLALVQVGGDYQAPFIEWAQRELLDAARAV